MHGIVRLILAFVAIILLPSCGPQKRKSKKAALQKAAFSLHEIETQIDVDQSVVELEAKLIDIPTALGSRLSSITQISEQPYQLCATFLCTQNIAELDEFYTEQMAYQGWQTIAHICGDELMQIYKKPSKICVISFRPITSDSIKISLVVSEIQADIY